MQSALIVHSRHNKRFARKIARKYKKVSFYEVTQPPSSAVLRIRNNKDVVIGIGGGSVIDTAKIISGKKRCIVIPTTASGAAVTPYATVWAKGKISIATKKPILKNIYSDSIHLPPKVFQSTLFDALSHAVESFWSKNATQKSRLYSKKAIRLLRNFLFEKNKNGKKLVIAGNLAGKAIAITKTNIIHAVSYPITIKYKIDHGTACGMILPYFIEYVNFKALPKLFRLKSNVELANLLKSFFVLPKIRKFDAKLIAKEAIKYDRINDGPRKMSTQIVNMLLRTIKI